MAKFILSKKVVFDQYNFLKPLADYISYSSKTNQDVTKILEQSNCFFSVHFFEELKHIKNKSRVIFIAQGWDSKFIQKLIDLKISNFIVDNEVDLDILLKFLETHDKKINLFLRLKLKENTIKTERYFVFGMSADIINKRLNSIPRDKIEKLGIHFHRKTQNLSEWNLTYELSNIIENWDKLDIVNIGGGLPSHYANTNIKVFDSIYNKIKELKSFLNDKNISLMIEPGRFIAAPACKLVTKIICIHENNIIVDASVYNTDMDALIVPVKLRVENELFKEELEEKETKPYVIKGITPCSLDIFRYKVYLNTPKVGDTITFLNAGAYNFHSDFCDLNKIPTEVVEE